MKGTLRRWFEDRLRERITLSGALYLGAMLMVGMAAFASANNLLFLLLAAMLATLMVSGFISRLGIASLELDIQLPEHICARADTAARFVLRNEKRWFPSFSITVAGVEDSVLTRSLYFPVIPGRATLEETVNVRWSMAKWAVTAPSQLIVTVVWAEPVSATVTEPVKVQFTKW